MVVRGVRVFLVLTILGFVVGLLLMLSRMIRVVMVNISFCLLFSFFFFSHRHHFPALEGLNYNEEVFWGVGE